MEVPKMLEVSWKFPGFSQCNKDLLKIKTYLSHKLFLLERALALIFKEKNLQGTGENQQTTLLTYDTEHGRARTRVALMRESALTGYGSWS